MPQIWLLYRHFGIVSVPDPLLDMVTLSMPICTCMVRGARVLNRIVETNHFWAKEKLRIHNQTLILLPKEKHHHNIENNVLEGWSMYLVSTLHHWHWPFHVRPVQYIRKITALWEYTRSISHDSGSPKKYSGGRRPQLICFFEYQTLQYAPSISPECGDFSFITLLP